MRYGIVTCLYKFYQTKQNIFLKFSGTKKILQCARRGFASHKRSHAFESKHSHQKASLDSAAIPIAIPQTGCNTYCNIAIPIYCNRNQLLPRPESAALWQQREHLQARSSSFEKASQGGNPKFKASGPVAISNLTHPCSCGPSTFTSLAQPHLFLQLRGTGNMPHSGTITGPHCTPKYSK